jgi:hypothetical protein
LNFVEHGIRVPGLDPEDGRGKLREAMTRLPQTYYLHQNIKIWKGKKGRYGNTLQKLGQICSLKLGCNISPSLSHPFLPFPLLWSMALAKENDETL